MIDPKLLRADPDAVARNLARRGFELDVGALRALEEKRKPWAVEVDRLRAERNANAKAVGMAKGKDLAGLLASGELHFAEKMLAELTAGNRLRSRIGRRGVGDEIHGAVDGGGGVGRRFAFDKLLD